MHPDPHPTSPFLRGELSEAEQRPERALFHVIPAPLELTVSYGSGARRGPQAILEASEQLERWDGAGEPCEAGIYTQAPVLCDEMSAAQEELRRRGYALTQARKLPVTLGGEHSVSYGVVKGIMEALGRPIGLIQIDAHADLRVAYQGHEHSHASVMHLLAQEGCQIASLGVRAFCKEEAEQRERYGVYAWDAEELVTQNIQRVTLPEGFPEEVYITFDLDGLDPAVLPATGTPVPGGLGFYQSLSLISSALEGRRCVGLDVVELAPVEGQPVSDFTAALITYRLMGLALRSLGRSR